MIMFSKITKQVALISILLITHELPATAQFGIDWTGITTSIIDESARSEVQKIFQPLSTINFIDPNLGDYRKAASALGMKNPTTVEALMLLEHGIRPLTASSLPTLTNIKLTDLGNGTFRNLTNMKIDKMKAALQKNDLSDYLSLATIQRLNTEDPDGSFSSRLKESITPQLALMLNNRSECIKTLRDNPALLQFGVMHIIPYFSYKRTSHAPNFKKKAIPNIDDWHLTILSDNTMLVSSTSGEIGRVKKCETDFLTIELGDDPLWFNCNLPKSSKMHFGNTVYVTDRLGRVETINFSLIKGKYKDSKKRQLKGKEILTAKGESTAKPHLLVPKNFGGIETWTNVAGITDSKENKQNQKLLDKTLNELSRETDRPITVKLSYNSSSDSPSLIQYFIGNRLICSFKYK